MASEIQPFGGEASVHIPQEARLKSDLTLPKAWEGILVGRHSAVRNTRFSMSRAGGRLHSRDVRFPRSGGMKFEAKEREEVLGHQLIRKNGRRQGIKSSPNMRQVGRWEDAVLPKGRTLVGCKWVFKTKRDQHGAITSYKARIVAKGYSQIPGQDFDAISSPVARLTSLRIILTMAGKKTRPRTDGLRRRIPQWCTRPTHFHGMPTGIHYTRRV